jgi:glycosyltransferase involved in cell wall biosynthesis
VIDRAAGARGGAAAARNAGAAAARAPVLAFTDADCEPDPRWLRTGLAAIRSGNDIVQGRVEPVRPAGAWDRTLQVHGEGLYQSANLFVDAGLFARLGGFVQLIDTPPGAPPMGEDTWLGWRARRAGARHTFEPDALVRHEVVARGPAGYLRERARVRHFPALVARVPELRSELCHRRVFFTRRSAALDLALLGVASSATARRRAPLLAALPYLMQVGTEASRFGRRAPVVGAVTLAGDVVVSAALIAGSLRARTILL